VEIEEREIRTRSPSQGELIRLEKGLSAQPILPAAAHHAGPEDWGQRRSRQESGVRFLEHFLDHTLASNFMRIRNWGFWSNRLRGTRLKSLRIALGVPVGPQQRGRFLPEAAEDAEGTQPAEEGTEGAEDTRQTTGTETQSTGETDETDGDDSDGRFRRVCPKCNFQALVLIPSIDKPSIAHMMNIQYWPGHNGWGAAFYRFRLKPKKRPGILPGFQSFLPGGRDYLESVAGGHERLSGHACRDSSALGFT